MNFGIKKENKKTFCKRCGRELNIVIPDQVYNFCPYCSSPLNLVAYNLVKEKERIIKLRTINEVQKVITDKEDLRKLIILIEEISKK
ncbi:MAG: hypothetical protein PHS54_05720 [Clostridia bacterium]|nr:hypothetical protein [Clostridia bacterium]